MAKVEIDFDRVGLLLGVAKTIDESFPKLQHLSAEAKDELAELNEEVKNVRQAARAVVPRPGMPADQQEAPIETPDADEEPAPPQRRAVSTPRRA